MTKDPSPLFKLRHLSMVCASLGEAIAFMETTSTAHQEEEGGKEGRERGKRMKGGCGERGGGRERRSARQRGPGRHPKVASKEGSITACNCA
jgi:hypothetical protein